jgi:hypothetical protein
MGSAFFAVIALVFGLIAAPPGSAQDAFQSAPGPDPAAPIHPSRRIRQPKSILLRTRPSPRFSPH